MGSAHTYKSPRWGSWKSANADPWDKIILVINDESDNWLADPNGVSNSKGSWDFQDYETIKSEAIRHIKNNNYNVSDLNYI